ncbi:hypothetical protein D3C74_328900 [compost metagenome]
MQTVSQFDHDDTDVLRHGDEHFAVVLVLLFFLGAELNTFQLRQAVNKHGTRIAEMIADLFK